MVHRWEPGTQYNCDDVVEYGGHKYKIIQPHRSQGDWTPPVTPALWGKMSDDCNDNANNNCHPHRNEPCQPHHRQEHHQQQQPIQQQQPSYSQGNNQQQQYQGGGKADEHHSGSDDEGKKDKKWFGIDEDKIKVGGGLLAGAAVLGGGMLAYKHHKDHKEEEQTSAWALSNWLEDAKARTAEYHKNGARGPATWVLTHGKTIPKGAIVVGQEHSWTLYICRAYHEGSIQVGKASDAFKKGGVIGYSHDEIHVEDFEVLIGDMNALRWVPTSGRLNVANLGYRPVEGGRDRDGTPLYVAQAHYKGAVHPGKASEKLDGAFIPYGDSEENIKEYRVLCYNN